MAPQTRVLLIPGCWEGTQVYDSLRHFLQERNYSTHAIPISSTGHKSPSNPSMKDDVASIRNRIEEAVEEGGDHEILLVLHSA